VLLVAALVVVFTGMLFAPGADYSGLTEAAGPVFRRWHPRWPSGSPS